MSTPQERIIDAVSSRQQITTILNIELDFSGRDTIAKISDNVDYTIIGEDLDPTMSAGVVGVGRARCRKADHYDPVIGTYLAVMRGIAEYARAVEDRAASRVLTNEEFLRRENEQLRDALDSVGYVSEVVGERIKSALQR